MFVLEQDSGSAPAGEVHWVEELGLKSQDKLILSTGEWLTDLYVAAANKLLKRQYPHQNGLQDTLALADQCRFRSSPTDFVQIVNISRSH